ncbi:36379_t:CDS:2, partial [Racocetra persica]
DLDKRKVLLAEISKESKAIKLKVVVCEAEDESLNSCDQSLGGKIDIVRVGQSILEQLKEKVKDNDVANMKHIRGKLWNNSCNVNDEAPKDIDHEIDNVDKMVKDNVDIRHMDFDGRKN